MRLTALLSLASFFALTVVTTGCVTDGPYVWVDELSPNDLKPPPYKLQVGDRLIVNVWNQQPLSGEVLVRPDGNITMPLVGDVFVHNLTPPQAAAEIAKRLNGMVVDPNVAVALTSNRNSTVSVVGEVQTAGSFDLRPGEGVLEILARAGGLSEFADRSRVFVVRKNENLRVRLNYDKLAHADGAAVKFMLQDGDVVVVD
jgi:polysaccharide biosynthesis/export protein